MYKFGSVLTIVICCLTVTCKGQSQETQYDVVPPSWITHDQKSIQESSTAYVFPSLYGAGSADKVKVFVPTFFLPRNRFHTPKRPFHWSVPGKDIEIAVSRNGRETKADIVVEAGSMTNIRRLDWQQFQDLQDSFRSWLCRRSDRWLFGDCETLFIDLDGNLIKIWKDKILAGATFKSFSDAYLNTTVSEPIPYTGKVSSIEKDQTLMFATRIVPGEAVVVTWGNNNLYPASGGILSSYSRVTSDGQTELRVIADNGMRVFPAGSCEMAGDAQASKIIPKNVLLPFPPSWADLFATEFVPIYNLFDLHNSGLLTASGVAGPSDCHDPRKGPDFLFLLSPAAYRKPDIRPTANIAQFENEARLGPDEPVTQEDARDDVNLLARQFLVVGCDSPDPNKPPDQFKTPDQRPKWNQMDSQHKLLADLNGEWDHLLERAFAAYGFTVPDAPTSSRSCGSFVNGLFAGKSFVELRHHYSINGHAADFGALNLQTIGQVLRGSFAAHLDRKATSQSSPLAEVLRSADVGNGISPGILRIRFYTTMSQVVDQANIFEGDEIRVDPISENLRQE